MNKNLTNIGKLVVIFIYLHDSCVFEPGKLVEIYLFRQGYLKLIVVTFSNRKGYKLNPNTLLYEKVRTPLRHRLIGVLRFLLFSFAVTVLVVWFYTSVLGLELPKTILLRKKNTEWTSKLELMHKRLDAVQNTLWGVAGRDEGIYRNIYGMNQIDPERRYSGFGGVNRYDYLEDMGASTLLKKTIKRVDYLTKAAYVQAVSFDDVFAISRRAGDMASCIPVVLPMNPSSKYRLSSSFGYRRDPMNGRTKFHAGIDFAMDIGTPLYSTGDGIVEKVTFDLRGYGVQVIIDHGFGYRTRYAHLKTALVTEKMRVKRGTLIGESGKTGKSTGPHLHYEVLYRGHAVNPYNYLDFEMETSEYETMVSQASEASGVIPPSKLPGKK